MKIDDDRVDILADDRAGDFAFDGGERIVAGGHAVLALRMDDENVASVLLDHQAAATGIARREIHRTQEPRLAVENVDFIALVIGVVAGGQRIGAGVEKRLDNRRRDAETAGGVFDIDDDEIERMFFLEAGQTVGERHAPAASHHIAENSNPQNSS
ncbi:MAG: hypothetical protein R3C58_02365 [Parvularculaceae bacterium]